MRLADPAKRAAVCALLPGSPWLAQAPELFIFCADGSRLRRIFAKRDKVFPNEHLDAFFNASVDAAIALGAFVAAAELAGLGTCPISQIRDHVAKVDELLELPDWVVPVAGLVLGYPEQKEPLSARLSLSATVHTDRYDRAAVEREPRRVRRASRKGLERGQGEAVQHCMARGFRGGREAEAVRGGLREIRGQGRKPAVA